MRTTVPFVVFVGLSACGQPPDDNQDVAPTSTDQDFNIGEIRVEPVGDGVYVFYKEGGSIAGNMLVSIGDDGVLLVDDQIAEIVPRYQAEIAELGGGAIDFVINTHWHFDHAGGNELLGDDGARFVAHENSRTMMMRDNVINLVTQNNDQLAYGPQAWPVVTFDETMRMYFNGDRIDLMHFGVAHTTGDTAVIFRDRNLVHLGDVFNTSGYPFIDADNGGDLPGLIAFCQAVLDELEPGATVIPGHGPVSDYATLERYIEMLTDVRGKITALIADGASLDQVVAARPTADWDAEFGDPTRMIDRAYASLSR